MRMSNPMDHLVGAQKQRQKALLQAGDCSDWNEEKSGADRFREEEKNYSKGLPNKLQQELRRLKDRN